ncbi:conserved exported hypothetical protein [Desulfosarcina cetonica]|uniref:FmdE family protein n=1 Tax=Desulfosarcina cetonica TaxID=90730 RepID=UPI0006D1946D|nr:FmdE family protein [Desulfosarcina cetonica]VTR64351.1 conserved exported hypothetical protein [Desulfosarcina cetonica]
MFRQKRIAVKTVVLSISIMILLVTGFAFSASARDCSTNSDYAYWKTVGRQAAKKAVKMLPRSFHRFNPNKFVALTNAGYAEIDGQSTMGALDGLVQVLGVGRGDSSLVEVHSAADKALWFAIYQPRSGFCVYLEVDPDAVYPDCFHRHKNHYNLFSTVAMEQINATHLLDIDNAEEYAEKFDNKIFGGNEFRIVTIANAVAEGAPTYAIRSFEFHDHYCPGVTSGILMAQYLKTFYPLETGGSYFVQGVKPSCKEDALQVMLNTTPGKGGYSVTYPTSEDIDNWPEDLQSARNIAYVKQSSESTWTALVLGYQGGETGCLEYGHSVMNKLCADLWYLEKLDQPEEFVTVLDSVSLESGESPKDYARPGMDPILTLFPY